MAFGSTVAICICKGVRRVRQRTRVQILHFVKEVDKYYQSSANEQWKLVHISRRLRLYALTYFSEGNG